MFGSLFFIMLVSYAHTQRTTHKWKTGKTLSQFTLTTNTLSSCRNHLIGGISPAKEISAACSGKQTYSSAKEAKKQVFDYDSSFFFLPGAICGRSKSEVKTDGGTERS